MIANFVSWFTNNPFQALAVMIGVAVVSGLVAIRPSVREHVSQHHPRC